MTKVVKSNRGCDITQDILEDGFPWRRQESNILLGLPGSSGGETIYGHRHRNLHFNYERCKTTWNQG